MFSCDANLTYFYGRISFLMLTLMQCTKRPFIVIYHSHPNCYLFETKSTLLPRWSNPGPTQLASQAAGFVATLIITYTASESEPIFSAFVCEWSTTISWQMAICFRQRVVSWNNSASKNGRNKEETSLCRINCANKHQLTNFKWKSETCDMNLNCWCVLLFKSMKAVYLHIVDIPFLKVFLHVK